MVLRGVGILLGRVWVLFWWFARGVVLGGLKVCLGRQVWGGTFFFNNILRVFFFLFGLGLFCLFVFK